MNRQVKFDSSLDYSDLVAELRSGEDGLEYASADALEALMARIAELEARIKYIEAHVDGLVRTHSQFAAAAEGSWSGKKQRVRAAEASQILAFIRKEQSAARAALGGDDG
jgi:hypothetical protein